MIAKQYFSIYIDKYMQRNFKGFTVSFLKVYIKIYFLFETKSTCKRQIENTLLSIPK